MRSKSILVMLMVILTSTVSQAEILYCFQYVGPPAKSRMVALDVQNGQVVSKSYFPALDAYMQCAGFDDSSNTLYSWDSYSDSLCTMDIITGIHTIIGGSGGLPGDTKVHSLAIDPNTNDMFAMSYSGVLYQVDKTNGNRTYIGKVSSFSHVHGFTFSPNGVAYCSDTTISNGSELFTLNTETAEASFIAKIPREYVISLDFDANGTLYGSDSGTGKLGIIDTTNGQWTDIDSVGGITGMAFGPTPESVTAVSFDIKPGGCPNPLNIKSKGVLPAAILGAEDFDVNSIDAASIRLAGVAAIRSGYEDVSSPAADSNECECSEDGGDGFVDLTLKFDTQEIVAAIGDVNNSDELILELEGVLSDGTAIEGSDCIIIVGVKKSQKPDVNEPDVNEPGVSEVSGSVLSELVESSTSSYPACWDYPTQCHGDTDGDGDVDTVDWPIFRNGFKGDPYPDAAYMANACADLDRDGDVDTEDWPLFRNTFKGPGGVAAADCTQGDLCGVYGWTYPSCWDCAKQCHGDINCDGSVDALDTFLFTAMGTFYPGAGYDPCQDFDRDGDVDTQDFLTLQSSIGMDIFLDCDPGDWNEIYKPSCP